MTNTRFQRQADLVDSSIFRYPINVIGAGGIGSFTALALAKCGFNQIRVFDFDSVEEHNLPNQFYKTNSIGNSKVGSLYNIVKEFTDVEIVQVNKEFKRNSDKLQGVVVSAVDSMKVRRDIWDSIARDKDVVLFVDGRMGANQLEVYTCDMRNTDDRDIYKKTLVPDSKTANVPCTQRAVMYNVLNIASWVVNQVRLVLMGREYKRELIMDLENMILVIPEHRKE